MKISWRRATGDDVAAIVALYRDAVVEQEALRPVWPLADGLAEPEAETLRQLLESADSFVAVGTIDAVVFGFIWARVEDLLPQASGERIGVIRQVYVAEPARGVGVGEAMLEAALADFRARGLRRFDAIVSPGHRLAKNFFEAAGFSARRITMYHDDGAP